MTILNRGRGRAESLRRELGAHHAGGLDELAKLPCDLLLNTTSVGMGEDASPVPAEQIPGNAVVLDAVYQPEETRFLRDAARAGAVTVGGKWMLIAQAVEQIRTWTGREAPADVMARAFDRAGS